MKTKQKNILLVALLIGSLLSITTNVSADPVIDTAIDPEEPEQLSSFTITADITYDEEIDSVNVTISECEDIELCFLSETFPMQLENGVYTYTYQITRDAATVVKYSYEIVSNGSSYETEDEAIYLKMISGDDDDDDDGPADNGDNGTPGFELIILMVSIAIGIIYIKRKR